LRAGSAKEDAARRYVEGRLLHVSRRYTKKFQPLEDSRVEDVKGYESMAQVAKDLEEIIDVVWLSGTRMFIPNKLYFISVDKELFGNSKFTNTLSVEYCGICQYLSPCFSTISQIHGWSFKKARSCIF
jgi:hypothetical protein